MRPLWLPQVHLHLTPPSPQLLLLQFLPQLILPYCRSKLLQPPPRRLRVASPPLQPLCLTHRAARLVLLCLLDPLSHPPRDWQPVLL